MQRNHEKPQAPPKPGTVLVLGGNSTTLACTSSLRADQRQIGIALIPLAWTPTGVVTGDLVQRVGVAPDNVAGWLDQTFAPEDPHAFITPLHDIELLMRTGWHAEAPGSITEDVLVNPDDIPEEVLDGIGRPTAALTQCAVCKRACVRDEFAWNERQLCAWDYHATVLGKRGPWRNEPYEERFFDTLPRAAYVAAPLLEEIAVDTVLAVQGFPEAASRVLVNTAIAQAPGMPYLAVRTSEGFILLRERG
jgi:hypothetical protein